MIEVTDKLNVSASELYETILTQTAAEISTKIDKEVTAADLKGGYKYSYDRLNGKKSVKAKVTIAKPVENRLVETHYVMGDLSYAFSYQIKEIDAENCEVTYRQEGNKKSGKLEAFMLKRRIGKIFRQFEQVIKYNRE